MSIIVPLEDFEYLNTLYHDDIKKFNEVVNDFLEIEAKPYIGYDYFDHGTYIGNSQDSTLHDLLKSAYISHEYK